VAPTGRRKRLSAEETRDRLVRAGIDSIIANGMTIGLDSVNLEQAVVDAGVSRSSAYAAWSHDDQYTPQELFQRTVLRQAVIERKETIANTQSSVLDVIDRMRDDGPRALLSELSRVAGGLNARAVADSRSWQLVVALRSVLHSAAPEARDDELADWVSESERLYREETIEGIYRPLTEVLRIKPREVYGDAAFHYGEITAAALSEGLAPRYFMSSSEYLEGIVRPGCDGVEREWSLFAIVFEQLVLTFFEPIDPAEWETPINAS